MANDSQNFGTPCHRGAAEDMRKLFEEVAFRQRFLSGIKKTGTGQFPFSVSCPHMDEFIKRDEKGDYVDPILSAMWWAWQEALKHAGGKK
jgi:hypothetical protein